MNGVVCSAPGGRRGSTCHSTVSPSCCAQGPYRTKGCGTSWRRHKSQQNLLGSSHTWQLAWISACDGTVYNVSDSIRSICLCDWEASRTRLQAVGNTHSGARQVANTSVWSPVPKGTHR